MAAKLAQDAPAGQDIANALKGWVVIALTLTFVGIYGTALTGWLKPLADEKMVMRLEQIIFVIIGYYFGRLPAQQNEKTLKEEIGRQTQKADAAQHAKEQAQQSRESWEEKVKNARGAGRSRRVGAFAGRSSRRAAHPQPVTHGRRRVGVRFRASS
jgi:hypothetical protein